MSDKPTANSLPLKIAVDEKQQRVVFAEADASFADTIFSFLTLPLGTVVKILRSHKSDLTIGCINNLHQSVSNMQSGLFQTSDILSILLRPINAAHEVYKYLRVKVDAQDWIHPPNYYYCQNFCNYSLLVGNQCNNCGKWRCSPPTTTTCLSGAFVNDDAKFVITEDMKVLPLATSSILSLLEAHGLTNQCNYLKQKIVYFEAFDLLASMLSSETPLTDLVFSKKSQIANVHHSIAYKKHSDEEKDRNRFSVKLIYRKSDRKLLYCESGANFVDLILSFLGFPLSAIVKLLDGELPTHCLNIMYKSITSLSYHSSMKFPNQLLYPMLAPHFYCNHHLIPVVGQLYSKYYVNQNHSIQPYNHAGTMGFLKGSGVFMVTDNLVVTPLSSTSVVSLFDQLKVPPSDVGEKIASVGKSEVISLLRASVMSNQVLTDVFGSHIV